MYIFWTFTLNHKDSKKPKLVLDMWTDGSKYTCILRKDPNTPREPSGCYYDSQKQALTSILQYLFMLGHMPDISTLMNEVDKTIEY